MTSSSCPYRGWKGWVMRTGTPEPFLDELENEVHEPGSLLVRDAAMAIVNDSC